MLSARRSKGRDWAASLMKQIRIRSYFSLPTDLAAEIGGLAGVRRWREVLGRFEGRTGETVSVRFIEAGEDCYVTVEAATSGKLFERVVGRVVCALSEHSDNLMVSDHG